jgi:hypothetical protein
MVRLLIYTLFLIFFIHPGISQEIISQTPIKLKTINSEKPIAFVDNDLNNHFLTEEGINISYFVIDNSGKLLTQNQYEKPPELFKVFQGYSFDDKNLLTLYFSNYQGTGFFKMTLGEKVEKYQFPINFESNEQFLTSVNYNKEFYFLTYLKNSSVLKKYSFDKEIPLTTKIDLNKHVFLDKNFQPTKLGRLLKTDNFSVINPKESLSLTMTSKTSKLYLEKESLILTLDHRNDGTRYLKFNPNSSREASFLFFENQDTKNSITEEIRQSNSFYFQQKLHLLSLSNSSLGLSSYDTESITLLNSHFGNIENGIKFTNSPFWNEGDEKGMKIFSASENSSRKELKSEKEFIRKLKSTKIGLWGIAKDGILKMELGGVKDITITQPSVAIFLNSNGMPGLGVPVTTSRALNRTFFRTQFNSNTMNHIKGISSTNAMERIRMKKRYLKNSVLKKRMKLETSFKKEDYYVLGYYDKKEKKYTLMKFEK